MEPREEKTDVPEETKSPQTSPSGTPREGRIPSNSLDEDGPITKPIRIDPASTEGNAKAYQFTDKHFNRMTKDVRKDLLSQVDVGLRSTAKDYWENWINYPTHAEIEKAYRQKYGRAPQQAKDGLKFGKETTPEFVKAFNVATKNKAKGCLDLLHDRAGDPKARKLAIPGLCVLLDDVRYSKIVRGILEGEYGTSTMYLCKEMRAYIEQTYAAEPAKKKVLLAKVPK